MNAGEWEDEFRRYREFPEWQQRQKMTMGEFQYIYAWEYGHRMLGRAIGVLFAVPWMYFSARRLIPKGYQPRFVGLLAMGATQGAVGWWMVQSGLGDDRRNDSHEIRVKPIRLTAHLSMALATYAALLWTSWDIGSLPHLLDTRKISPASIHVASRLRPLSLVLACVTATTIASGALVAGNDAGRAYNTWPLMGERLIPLHDLYELKPFWRNVVDHTPTVQFHHRLCGTITVVSAVGLAAWGLRRGHLVTPQVRQGLVAVGLAASAQFALGVATLVNYVPISLAASHQLGSLVVFTSSLYLSHALRYARPAVVSRL